MRRNAGDWVTGVNRMPPHPARDAVLGANLLAVAMAKAKTVVVNGCAFFAAVGRPWMCGSGR